MRHLTSSATKRNVQAADAKEVGVGNPAEETYCYSNEVKLGHRRPSCQRRILQNISVGSGVAKPRASA